MSELAKNERGDTWTAFEVKDEYLRNGTEFRWFVCAFCDTQVTPAAAYGDEFVVAPYFTLKEKSKPHSDMCPYGKATLKAYGIQRPPRKRTKDNFDVDLPDQLVTIRAAHTTTGPKNEPPTQLASPDEVRKRVRGSGEKLAGAHQYTTGLLRTLAIARGKAISALYEIAQSKGHDKKTQTSFVFGELKKYPLKVYGRQLDYDRAFRKTTYEPWDGTFIYHGSASVSEIETGFVLLSLDSVKSKDGSPGAPAKIQVVCDKNHPVNLMESKSIDVLQHAIRTSSTVRWFAYGALALNESRTSYELTVREPAYIYVRTE
jgi:hypothetical protein